MPPIGMRILAASVAAAMVLFTSGRILAQNGEQKPPEKPPAAEGKEPQKKVDEFAEAEKALTGSAGNPECVWLGRRVVNLLWRDDLDTAFRHLDLYDRFRLPVRPHSSDFPLRCAPGKHRSQSDRYAAQPGACLLAQSDPRGAGNSRRSQHHHEPLGLRPLWPRVSLQRRAPAGSRPSRRVAGLELSSPISRVVMPRFKRGIQ